MFDRNTDKEKQNIYIFLVFPGVTPCCACSDNNHTGIQFAKIETFEASKKDISEFSRDIVVVQKQLGVADAKIALEPWNPGGRPWRF